MNGFPPVLIALSILCSCTNVVDKKKEAKVKEENSSDTFVGRSNSTITSLTVNYLSVDSIGFTLHAIDTLSAENAEFSGFAILEREERNDSTFSYREYIYTFDFWLSIKIEDNANDHAIIQSGKCQRSSKVSFPVLPTKIQKIQVND